MSTSGPSGPATTAGSHTPSETSPPSASLSGGGAGSGGSDAKEKAKQAAGAAGDEASHVAGVAQDQARRVASEATSQAKDLVGQATSQVEDQLRTQQGRLAETVGTLGDDLQSMASQSEGGLAADLAREVADRAHQLASHLDGREPRDLLDDVRAFARRRPGLFLGGALAAGVVAGRLTRGAKDAKSGSSSGGSSSPAGSAPAVPTEPLTRDVGARNAPRPTSGSFESADPGLGTAAGTPLEGTGRPVEPPVYPGGAGDRP